MSEFNFKSQICTSREQSEKLLALGLKKETADMVYEPHYINGVLKDYFEPKILEKKVLEYMLMDEAFKDYIPAWSLHRLIEMALRYVLICGISFTFNEDAYEKVIGIIEHQIKEGYFPKEYLEE